MIREALCLSSDGKVSAGLEESQNRLPDRSLSEAPFLSLLLRGSSRVSNHLTPPNDRYRLRSPAPRSVGFSREDPNGRNYIPDVRLIAVKLAQRMRLRSLQ